LIEIQDLGSQLLLEAAGIAPGARWLDACAGAGGKTLQLSRLLGSAGSIDAHDVRASALAELAVRARRASVPIADSRQPAPRPAAHCAPIRIVQAPAAFYDGVLVDAPCSGSGTWRRAPHLKWTTTPTQIAGAASLQRELLAQFSRHVRPGGRLLYCTCSLSRRENEDVIDAFLAGHPEFSIAPPASNFDLPLRGGGLTFFPARHDTDGFFVACLRRA
jgi:16S rRNA (cytosine967-C5)-methyltransferase